MAIKKLVSLIVSLIVCVTSFAQNNDSVQQASNPLEQEVLSIAKKVTDENRLVGNVNPDSVSSLPLGIIKEIGPTRYIIAIDSSTFKANSAKFNAYMALEFPGSQQKIAFAAKNIAFNPKGVMPGNNTRLVLVSEQRISIGPKVTLILMPDGGNYVEWDCNGFKAVNLKGYFEFSNEMLVPDPTASNETSVKASFEIYTSDIHNLVTQVGITPFVVKGLNDMSFSVTEATVDMSEIANSPGMVFPQGYNVQAIGPSPTMWTGFYMKQFKVKLPKEISKGSDRMEVYANNFLIDKSGVTGQFQINNLFALNEGNMSGWNFSIDQLGVNFVSNHLNGGNIAGSVKLPINDNTGLSYNATLLQNASTQEMDYMFVVSPASNLSAPVLSATVNLYSTSKLIVSKINGKLKPEADLNGDIVFDHANFKVMNLNFQQVVLSTDPPYLKSGIFSLTNGNAYPQQMLANNVGGFNMSINDITVVISATAPAIGFNVGFSFTEQNESGFAASTGITVLTKVDNIPVNDPGQPIYYRANWKFDRVRIDDIGLAVNSTAFNLNGLIKFRENDPIYGKGFFGGLNLSIADVMPQPASANVCFGTKNNYKYFYVDAAVPITQVLIPPTPECPEGLALYRFMGGIYYHMKQPNGGNNLSNALYTPNFGAAQNYVPDANTALGLKAGVTAGIYPNAALLNGDITLEVNFNSTGGLGLIKFSGDAFLLTKIQDRMNKKPSQLPARASLTMLYDNNNHAFHAALMAFVNLPTVTAQGQAELHLDPTIWYLDLGKPSSRLNINLGGIANLSSYIMVGNTLEPMPAAPAAVSQVVNDHGLANQRDNTQLLSGNGMSFGANFSAGKNQSFGFDFFEIYYNASYGVGFDLMLHDYGPNAHCSGTTDKAGVNGWYANGQLYAYLQGGVGARGHIKFLPDCDKACVLDEDFDINIANISAAALLEGKFPKPNYVRGAVGVDYSILGGHVNGHLDFDIEFGNQCNVVN